MNSRRLIASPEAEETSASRYTGTVDWAELPQRPLWVISSHFAMRELYPPYPRKRTFGIASAIPLSAKSRHTP
ncbi:MAG: hypothetical protein WBZ27_21730, partial [Pseudolabrys sp.]